MPKAGEFELRVSDPYPCWTHLFYKGRGLCSIHHNELSDLEYVVEKAIKEAKAKLEGREKEEV